MAHLDAGMKAVNGGNDGESAINGQHVVFGWYDNDDVVMAFVTNVL